MAAAPDECRMRGEELEAYLDQLGNVARGLDRAEPEELAELYSSLRLSLTYYHGEQIAEIEVDPAGPTVWIS